MDPDTVFRVFYYFRVQFFNRYFLPLSHSWLRFFGQKINWNEHNLAYFSMRQDTILHVKFPTIKISKCCLSYVFLLMIWYFEPNFVEISLQESSIFVELRNHAKGSVKWPPFWNDSLWNANSRNSQNSLYKNVNHLIRLVHALLDVTLFKQLKSAVLSILAPGTMSKSSHCSILPLTSLYYSLSGCTCIWFSFNMLLVFFTLSSKRACWTRK